MSQPATEADAVRQLFKRRTTTTETPAAVVAEPVVAPPAEEQPTVEAQPQVDLSKLQTRRLLDYQDRRIKDGGPSVLGLARDIETSDKIFPERKSLSFMDKVRRIFGQEGPDEAPKKSTGIPQEPSKSSPIN